MKTTMLLCTMTVAGTLLAPGPSRTTAPAKTLTADGARQVLAAAIGEANRRKTTGAFAVVDAGGHLIALERLDGTFVAAAGVATGKARTAAMFQKPTRVFEDLITSGRTPMIALDDFTPLQGGEPIMSGGVVVGAIGVSGAASAREDDELAGIGAAALTRSMASGMTGPAAGRVTYMPAGDVAAAFSRGAPLLETDAYKIHASRRLTPGEAEVHEHETDLIYVVEGTATFVTGGVVVGGRSTGNGEVRGPSIDGGRAQRLTAGDVIVVPAGTPHWFREVQGPFLYYVVKVL